MNDIERAISTLKILFRTADEKTVEGFRLRRDIPWAISALEKQIPKKPILQSKYDNGDCPICNATINYKNYYCHNCGQKLDWEEI